MPRVPRNIEPGLAYHVLNRANARLPLFEKDADYSAFLGVFAEALDRYPVRVLSYCLMPNHFHFVLWPDEGQSLSNFVGWLTLTHTQRWHAFHKTVGSGHLYQGRFKSFPVQEDDHLLTVCRYVERNPVRAKLVEHAEQWQWSSLHRREDGDTEPRPLLSKWPLKRPTNWVEWVNKPQTPEEEETLSLCINRGRPYGDDVWLRETAERLHLNQTLRSRGRPKKLHTAKKA